jgi:uncharacterized protein YbjT (DUF2867 family)
VILVAGASGFVGQALVGSLTQSPSAPLRAFVRTELDAVRLRDRGVEAAVGDLVAGRGLDAAMRGVHTLVYLVHAMEGAGDLVASDLAAARNPTLAARAAGVDRIVFLGHVAATPETKARYLVARWAVERTMEQSGVTCTVLRAPLIVGAGAEPFSLACWPASRLPIAPMFSWHRTVLEPVALADVVEGLSMAIADRDLDGRSFDLCGAERMTAGDMVRTWARTRGRHYLPLPLPFRGVEAMTWSSWATRHSAPRRTRALVETLFERQLCTDPSRRFPLPHRPLSYREALAAL